MLFFQSIPWYSALMWFVVLGTLMLLNEIGRRTKWLALILFTVLPLILTIFVWPTTAGPDSTVGTWFHWVKVYSALAACLGFWALRHIKGAENHKWLFIYPALILAINITEAVIRDFQISTMTKSAASDAAGGMTIVPGAWNVMNGIAGILNIITITGFLGIFIGRDKYKDLLWPDQLWFWIIAYDLWNFAYVYNCVSDHAFYAGLALLLSCTLPAIFIKKGTWVQARAHTLAFWMMFVMSYPEFIDSSKFAVDSSHNETALMIVSGLSLASNIAVFVYYVYKVAKTRRNPLTEELYTDLKAYEEVAQFKA